MMKVISLRDAEPMPEMYREAAEILEDDGLVCFPCGGTYRVVANLASNLAVTKLFHSKRRTKSTAALVFVVDRPMLESIAVALHPLVGRVIDRLWPGNVTVLVEPELELPKRTMKQITKTHGKIGVRVPAGEIARGVLEAFGGPLLVSSANLAKKQGAYSPAQVRKNFINNVDLFFDIDDLKPASASTVVEIRDDEVTIVRPGAISEEEILEAVTSPE